MVFVQHGPGVGQVEVVRRRLRPRKRDQPVEVTTDHAELGGRRRQSPHPVEFAAGLLVGLIRHRRRVDPSAQLFDLRPLLVVLSQLALDGLELFSQEVLSLHFLDLGASFLLDLLTEREHLDFPDQNRDQPGEFLRSALVVEDRLGRLHFHALIVGHGVCQVQRIFQQQDSRQELARQRGNELGDLLELILDRPDLRLDLHPLFHGLGPQLDGGLQVRVFFDERPQLEAGQPLHDQADCAIGSAQESFHRSHRAVTVQVVGARLVQLGPARSHQPHQTPAADDVVHQADRPGLSDGQRDRGVRVGDQTTQRQDRQDRRDLFGRSGGRGRVVGLRVSLSNGDRRAFAGQAPRRPVPGPERIGACPREPFGRPHAQLIGICRGWTFGSRTWRNPSS